MGAAFREVTLLPASPWLLCSWGGHLPHPCLYHPVWGHIAYAPPTLSAASKQEMSDPEMELRGALSSPALAGGVLQVVAAREPYLLCGAPWRGSRRSSG